MARFDTVFSRVPGLGRVVLGLVITVLTRVDVAQVDVYRQTASSRVSRPFPSWKRSILAEIYLCDACSDHETEDGNAGLDR
eukprot:COSAG01_NODE_246_length_20450_cov_195.166822_16_plen_81_part_00